MTDMFGIRLKQCRMSKKLTQRDLALQMNVSPGAVAQWECASREPNLSIVIELAEFFGVSTDYLLGRTDNPLEQKFGKNTVTIEARPTPIEQTEPLPLPDTMKTGTFGHGKSIAVEKKLTGTESHDELEALVRKMVEQILKEQEN